MYKTKMAIVVASVAMLLVASAPAWAITVDGTKDSASFTNSFGTVHDHYNNAGQSIQFEGDVSSVSQHGQTPPFPVDDDGVNLAISGGAAQFTEPGDAGIMHWEQSGVTATTRRFNDTQPGGTLDASLVTGFTMEFRLKVNSISDPGGGEYGGLSFQMASVGGANPKTFSWSRPLAGGTKVAGVNVAVDTSVYHSYRFAVKEEGGVIKGNYYVDQTLALTDFVLGAEGGSPKDQWTFITDLDFNGDFDYVRIDTSGAYAPVPEPATMLLLGLGGLLAGLRRKA